MQNSNTVRTDIKQVAQQIENLARQVQTNVDQGKDILAPANELARNISTFVFTLGEMYALEQSGKKVRATTVSNPSNTSRYSNYHSKRDTATGRFIKA
jgi:uncharacterized protein YoxC